MPLRQREEIQEVPRGQLSAEGYARLAFEVASEAGALVLAGYRKRPTPTEKARRDLVTEFDLNSEALIVARLSAATPELSLVAEERGGARSDGLCWFCDPLDGTTNFVHGHPFWAVSIGLLDGGTPLAGAVVAPALGLTWLGYRGGPALRATRRPDRKAGRLFVELHTPSALPSQALMGTLQARAPAERKALPGNGRVVCAGSWAWFWA